MKGLLRLSIAAVTAAATVLVLSAAAFAATPAQNSATISVSQPSQSSDNLTLSAQFGATASGQKVTFFVQTHEFAGDGWMAVGSAAMNSSGEATYTYTPTWTGETVFGAAVGSETSVTSPSVTGSFNVLKDPTGVPQSVIEYSRPLGGAGGGLVKGLLTTVAVIWILLIGSVVLVFWRMPRLAAETGTDERRKG